VAGTLEVRLGPQSLSLSGLELGEFLDEVAVGILDYEATEPAVVFVDEVEICGRPASR
jgi:hypothetical protein